MRQLSLFWKLYLSYLLVIVLALLMVVVGSYAVRSLPRELLRATSGGAGSASLPQCPVHYLWRLRAHLPGGSAGLLHITSH